MKRRFAPPSPALVVAFVALVAALGGSAVALPGKNKVDSNDIKRNAVNSADIRNGTVTSADVRNDGLTGTDINESTLGKVPNATSADSAANATSATVAGTAANATNATNAANADTVAGHEFRTFSFRVENNGPSGMFDFHNVRLEGNCVAAAPNLDISEPTADDASRFSIHGASEGLVFGNGGALGTSLTDALPDNAAGSATATVYRGNGEVVILTYSAQFVPTNACLYYGQGSVAPSTTG